MSFLHEGPIEGNPFGKNTDDAREQYERLKRAYPDDPDAWRREFQPPDAQARADGSEEGGKAGKGGRIRNTPSTFCSTASIRRRRKRRSRRGNSSA